MSTSGTTPQEIGKVSGKKSREGPRPNQSPCFLGRRFSADSFQSRVHLAFGSTALSPLALTHPWSYVGRSNSRHRDGIGDNGPEVGTVGHVHAPG